MTTAQPSCDQSHRAGEQSTAGKQAASAPEAQPPHYGAGEAHPHYPTGTPALKNNPEGTQKVCA